MNIVFTCGGTGGHIYPAIAVARLFQLRQPGCRVLFIGAEDGMETKLVPREGFRLETLKISNFQRKLTPGAILHNCRTAVNLLSAKAKARQLLREFSPDIVIGTGGYASFPALREGARMGIATMVHESNAVPGLTTRMVEKQVDRILVSFEDSRKAYHAPEKVIVTGTPVRDEFFFTARKNAREKLGLDERPFIVSCWGSLGAREMNKKIAEFMKCEIDAGEPYQHLHATGSYGWRWMPEFVKEQGVDLSSHPALDMREYIFDMPTAMAAADLVICRAGAATISEVCASAAPCIMVPSPNVTNNHQEKNAMVLKNCGAAEVMREAECTGKSLFKATQEILHDEKKIAAMRKAASDLSCADAAQRIYEAAMALLEER